jgi:fermentation-respiration switch protein FrsA (DUF1100 family)
MNLYQSDSPVITNSRLQDVRRHYRARPSAVLVTTLVLTLLAGCQQAIQPKIGTARALAAATGSPTPGSPGVSTPSLAAASPTSGQSSPLAIGVMRAKVYPGSELVIENTLPGGPGYNLYVVSYRSDGLKLFGLLTVPRGDKPTGGWPVILLNHGYIPPAEYSTEQSYARVVAPLAEAGYIVFKPDYRGHGNSQGVPRQPYVAPDYVTDSMNALTSISKYKDANPNEMGVWGHSMGGNVTLHELLLTGDLKVAVIMAGVVGSYSDILDWWDARVAAGVLTTQNDLQTDQLILQMASVHGTPQTNPGYWDAIDPTSFVADIDTPVLIQVGSADEVVPPGFSQELAAQLQAVGKSVSFHVYPGADHNLSPDTDAAVAEAIAFFDQYLK